VNATTPNGDRGQPIVPSGGVELSGTGSLDWAVSPDGILAYFGYQDEQQPVSCPCPARTPHLYIADAPDRPRGNPCSQMVFSGFQTLVRGCLGR
jgi:hypothetical protein